MGHTKKTFTKDIIYHLLRTRSCLAKLHYPVTHQISFTISKCSTQKLPSCVISIILNFLAGSVEKIFMARIKLFSVTSVNFGFASNVTILIILITDIYKTVMNPGIA